MPTRHFRFVSRSLPMRRPSRVAEFVSEHLLLSSLGLLAAAVVLLALPAFAWRPALQSGGHAPIASPPQLVVPERAEEAAAVPAGVAAPFFVTAAAWSLPGMLTQHETASAPDAVEASTEVAEAAPGAPDAKRGEPDVAAVAADSAEEGRGRPATFSLAGTWGPSPAACSARTAARTRWLPMRITEKDARAGETVCAFKRLAGAGAAWTAVADCSGPRGRWVSTVRLRLEASTLVWSSGRGIQRYVRCERMQVATR